MSTPPRLPACCALCMSRSAIRFPRAVWWPRSRRTRRRLRNDSCKREIFVSEDQAVLRERRGRAFWITINRPEKRNAINTDVIAGVRAGYREAHADSEIRVIVLTGAGEKAFCAGGDLQLGKGFAFDLSRPNIEFA